MTFEEYLEKNGPTLEKLAGMKIGQRTDAALDAYQDWLGIRHDIDSDECSAGEYAFLTAFDLATEIMVYMHMVQDARAAEQETRRKAECLLIAQKAAAEQATK